MHRVQAKKGYIVPDETKSCGSLFLCTLVTADEMENKIGSFLLYISMHRQLSLVTRIYLEA